MKKMNYIHTLLLWFLIISTVLFIIILREQRLPVDKRCARVFIRVKERAIYEKDPNGSLDRLLFSYHLSHNEWDNFLEKIQRSPDFLDNYGEYLAE